MCVYVCARVPKGARGGRVVGPLEPGTLVAELSDVGAGNET